MPQRRTDESVAKQLKTVSEQLAGGKPKGDRRLALLRRQAQLGDERDAAIEKARRARAER